MTTFNLVMQNFKTLTITGTRHTNHLTDVQLENVQEYLQMLLLKGYTHLRHGDAIGADAHAHNVALALGYQVFIHPPSNSRFRAFCDGGILMTSRTYAQRNQDMVNACQLVLAIPNTNFEVVRSGTWQTIRMARQIFLPLVICYPNGQVDLEGFDRLF